MDSAINKDSFEVLEYQRAVLCRFVFAAIFIFLLYYLYSNALVHQLQSPVLIYPYVDLTYWIFHLQKIPELITANYTLACCFDLLLFVTCILSFWFPRKRGFITVFFILYFIFYIIFNTYATQHTHSKAGILLVPLPFMFPKKMFYFMWEALRYFTLFVYADAFVWKLCRMYFFTANHGSLVIKKNFAAYMFYNPHSLTSLVNSWLLKHEALVQVIFIAGFIMEGCFIAGFFTKKFDRYLFVFSLLLPVGFLFLSDAFFFEMLVLSFTLINIYQPPSKIVRMV